MIYNSFANNSQNIRRLENKIKELENGEAISKMRDCHVKEVTKLNKQIKELKLEKKNSKIKIR